MVVLMSVMNRRPENGLFEEVALLKTIDPSFIEKDWLVKQVIAVLANHNAEYYCHNFSNFAGFAAVEITVC